MTCTLTQGVPLTCRDAMGGISEIKIKALATVPAGLQATSGQITLAEPMLDGWYTYQFEKETGNLSETYNINTQNGTLYFTQTLTIKIHKLQTLLQSYQNVSNSQHSACSISQARCCKRFCKVIKMLAIHNTETANINTQNVANAFAKLSKC